MKIIKASVSVATMLRTDFHFKIYEATPAAPVPSTYVMMAASLG